MSKLTIVTDRFRRRKDGTLYGPMDVKTSNEFVRIRVYTDRASDEGVELYVDDHGAVELRRFNYVTGEWIEIHKTTVRP